MDYSIKYSVECLLGIERAILSSLITNDNTDEMEVCFKIIEANDFYYQQHGIIYNTIIEMYKSDKKIDENTVFLSNQQNINEQYYIDIITTTPPTSIKEYLNQLKKYSYERQMIIVATKIKEGSFSKIKVLHNLQEKFENIENKKDLRQINDKFEKLISNFDIDIEKIKDKKVEYLYDDFIIKNDITMIVSRPGIGKSLVSIALCNMFLNKEKIKKVIYFDKDNSLVTINTRNIHVLKEKYGNRLYYIAEKTDFDINIIISELKKTDLTDILIVFDSVKNFIIGDRNSHRDVTQFMNVLKVLRGNSASIIFLHHQNKLDKEFNSAFAGSSAFLEDISLAFELRKNEDKQTYIFIPIKDRNNVSNYIAFTYNQDNTLTGVDIDYALETQEELEIRELIINFIINEKDKPIYSDILKYLTNAGFNKDKVNKIIQSGKNKYWKATRIANQNNKLVFELLDNKDNSDKFKLGVSI